MVRLVGDFEAVHDAACDGRQVAHGIIPPAAAKLVAEGHGPVLRPHLPTVNVEHRPARLGRLLPRPNLAQQRPNKRIEVRVERGFVELVAFEAQAR